MVLRPEAEGQEAAVAAPRRRRRRRSRFPAYVRPREGGLAEQIGRLLMRGVSTRNYAPAMRKMADTSGVSKSQLSRY